MDNMFCAALKPMRYQATQFSLLDIVRAESWGIRRPSERFYLDAIPALCLIASSDGGFDSAALIGSANGLKFLATPNQTNRPLGLRAKDASSLSP
jgi:hypothetical protein